MSRGLTQETELTSNEALDGALDRLTIHEADIIEYLREQGSVGAADFELGEALEGYSGTIASARVRLLKRGLVKPSGQYRFTPRARRAVVWVLTDKVT